MMESGVYFIVMALLVAELFKILMYCVFYRESHCLTSEFRVKFHAKNRYRINLRKTNKRFTVIKNCIQI